MEKRFQNNAHLYNTTFKTCYVLCLQEAGKIYLKVEKIVLHETFQPLKIFVSKSSLDSMCLL